MAKLKKWRGKEVTQEVVNRVSLVLGEFGLTAEGHAKRELQKGHGVLTGTLRRSIHVAPFNYNWSQDQAAVTIKGKREKGSSYTLGGKLVNAEVEGTRIGLQLGSGLLYSLAVHQGHHSFTGYHYLTIGVDKAKVEMPKILRRHKL